MIWLPVSSHRMRSPLALVNDNCGRRAPSAIIVHSNFRHSCSKRCKKKILYLLFMWFKSRELSIIGKITKEVQTGLDLKRKRNVFVNSQICNVVFTKRFRKINCSCLTESTASLIPLQKTKIY